MKKVWFATGFAGIIAVGGSMLMSKLHDFVGPPNDALQSTLAGVTEVRVKRAGLVQIGLGQPLPQTLILSGLQAQELAQSFQVIPSRSGARGMCCCGGSHVVAFYRGDNLIASLSLMHGEKLRWKEQPWRGDMPMQISTKQYLKSFFKSHPKL